MLLCGFPTDIIGKMEFGNRSLQDLARQVLPVPVFMAIFLATLASVPWSDQARNGEIADADGVANRFDADDGDDMSDTEATLKHDMEEPGSIFARLKKPDAVSLCKWGKNRTVLNYTTLAVALSMRDEPSQPTVATKQPKVSQSRGSKD